MAKERKRILALRSRRIIAQKLEDSSSHDTRVVFNVGVNIEEVYRKSNSVALNFAVSLETEPSIGKLAIEGVATVTGNPAGVEKMLAADSSTNIPKVLTPIYEEIYSVLFMLVGTLDLPYPSPALLKKPHVGVSKAT